MRRKELSFNTTKIDLSVFVFSIIILSKSYFGTAVFFDVDFLEFWKKMYDTQNK